MHSGADPTEAEMIQLAEAGIDTNKVHEVDSDRDLEALITANVGIGLAPSSALQSQAFRHLPYSGLDLTRTVAVYTVPAPARTREAGVMPPRLPGAARSHVLGCSGERVGGIENRA